MRPKGCDGTGVELDLKLEGLRVELHRELGAVKNDLGFLRWAVLYPRGLISPGLYTHGTQNLTAPSAMHAAWRSTREDICCAPPAGNSAHLLSATRGIARALDPDPVMSRTGPRQSAASREASIVTDGVRRGLPAVARGQGLDYRRECKS